MPATTTVASMLDPEETVAEKKTRRLASQLASAHRKKAEIRAALAERDTLKTIIVPDLKRKNEDLQREIEGLKSNNHTLVRSA